ncbi:transcription elongation factor TFIIS-like [Zingiber officinale]|uniref:transcription elongation factor TFIIS-like n=1 Tax=Zingiber officinale TaxID=94328 RepID=UPI001C4C5BEE|nr:transcription elongation factor TFIIS-like [Zingiber officinale]
MEKELLETFEVAKKAADVAAEAGSGSTEVDRCVDALKQLRRIPVTMQDLVETQVGKRLRYLTKHHHSKIQVEASALLEYWKNIVIQETSNSKKNGSLENKISTKNSKPERKETIKIDKAPKAGSVTIDRRNPTSESPKLNKKDADLGFKTEISHSERNMIENNRSNKSGLHTSANNTERISKGENQASTTKRPSPASSAHPPKLTTMVKCNDPTRDKIRELLAEAFSKVPQETGQDDREEVRNILDEVDACDPIRVAVTVESMMFEKLGRSTGSQKLKYRSIMFNLKDGNNTDLRRKVLLGEVKPERLVAMTPDQMASDKRKLANEQIKEKALFDCERGGAPKATTDQFKCGRCGQRKCTYYQLQTRSADEPMTTFVTCVNCNNHWKFC